VKAAFSEGCGYVTFYRDEGDPRFDGVRFAKGEHSLFRFIAKWLNARGFDVIKKRAQKDGHMIGHEYQPYIRCSKPQVGAPHIMIWSGFYALRGANTDWNKGQVSLLLETDCFLKGQDTEAVVGTLCQKYPDQMSLGGSPHLRDLHLTGNETRWGSLTSCLGSCRSPTP